MSADNSVSFCQPGHCEYGIIRKPPSVMDIERLLQTSDNRDPARDPAAGSIAPETSAPPLSEMAASLLFRIRQGGQRDEAETAQAYNAALGALELCQISRNVGVYQTFDEISEASLGGTVQRLRNEQKVLELDPSHPWRTALSSCISTVKRAYRAKSNTETKEGDSCSTLSDDFMQSVRAPLDRCRTEAHETYLGSFARNAYGLLKVRSEVSSNKECVTRIDEALTPDFHEEGETAPDSSLSEQQGTKGRVLARLSRLETDMNELRDRADARKETMDRVVQAHAVTYRDYASEEEKTQAKADIRGFRTELDADYGAVHAAYQDVSVSLALLEFEAMQAFASVASTATAAAAAAGTEADSISCHGPQRHRVLEFERIRSVLWPFTAINVTEDEESGCEALFGASVTDVKTWRDEEPTIDSASLMRRVRHALSIVQAGDGSSVTPGAHDADKA